MSYDNAEARVLTGYAHTYDPDVPQYGAFTSFKHWKVVQKTPTGAGTVNWFPSRKQAQHFADRVPYVEQVRGVSCEEFNRPWPIEMRRCDH